MIFLKLYITDSLRKFIIKKFLFNTFLFSVEFFNLSSTRAWTIVLDDIERVEGSPSMIGKYRVPFLVSALHMDVIADGRMRKLTFSRRCYWFDDEVREPLGKCERMDTRRCLSDSVFSVVSSIRSVGHSAWTTNAVSYIFIR